MKRLVALTVAALTMVTSIGFAAEPVDKIKKELAAIGGVQNIQYYTTPEWVNKLIKTRTPTYVKDRPKDGNEYCVFVEGKGYLVLPKNSAYKGADGQVYLPAIALSQTMPNKWISDQLYDSATVAHINENGDLVLRREQKPGVKPEQLKAMAEKVRTDNMILMRDYMTNKEEIFSEYVLDRTFKTNGNKVIEQGTWAVTPYGVKYLLNGGLIANNMLDNYNLFLIYRDEKDRNNNIYDVVSEKSFFKKVENDVCIPTDYLMPALGHGMNLESREDNKHVNSVIIHKEKKVYIGTNEYIERVWYDREVKNATPVKEVKKQLPAGQEDARYHTVLD